jgi:hypothetical protein
MLEKQRVAFQPVKKPPNLTQTKSDYSSPSHAPLQRQISSHILGTHLFQIHSNITFPSKWSQLLWHFDENCVGIFHFAQICDYLLKITRKNIINFIYIPCFYETFVLCVLDSSYWDAPYTHTHMYLESGSLPLHISVFCTCDISLQKVEFT